MAATTRKALDRASLAERREERWQRRCARLDADVTMPPELRDLFKNRTLWGVKEQADFLGTSAARISVLRNNRILYRAGYSPFPSVMPDMDAPMGKGSERPRPGIEAGRLMEWAFDDHRVIWDSTNKVLVLNPHWRAGRKRKVQTGPTFRSLGKFDGDGRRARRGIKRTVSNNED